MFSFYMYVCQDQCLYRSVCPAAWTYSIYLVLLCTSLVCLSLTLTLFLSVSVCLLVCMSLSLSLSLSQSHPESLSLCICLSVCTCVCLSNSPLQLLRPFWQISEKHFKYITYVFMTTPIWIKLDILIQPIWWSVAMWARFH